MSVAKRDQNRIPVKLGTLDSDGVTPVMFSARPNRGVLRINDDTTGTYISDDIASRDANKVPVAMGVSSVDGVTLVAIYLDASGNLLVDST